MAGNKLQIIHTSLGSDSEIPILLATAPLNLRLKIMAIPNGPSLIIMFTNGRWQAAEGNSAHIYNFIGATPDEQFTQVRALRDLMESGNAGTVQEGLPEIFSDVTADNRANVFNELFIETEELIYMGEAVEGASGVSLAIDLAEIAAEWVL